MLESTAGPEYLSTLTTETAPKHMVTPRKRRAANPVSALQGIVTTALDDMKAVNIKVLDVRGLTDIADMLIIASGTSDRHVRSIAERVVEQVKAAGMRPYGVEGARDGEWVLVDLHEVIVHVMLPRVREFYGLERLWEIPPQAEAIASAARRGSRRHP
jgi:ribosome-associated protein